MTIGEMRQLARPLRVISGKCATVLLDSRQYYPVEMCTLGELVHSLQRVLQTSVLREVCGTAK